MLAIYLTDECVSYAQLVNYQGEPFVESTGSIELKEGMHPSVADDPEIRKYLADTIAKIRNSTEFPDNSAHIITDSSWFPLIFHRVDEVLTQKDLEKFLQWRASEMLDKAGTQFDLIHQPVERGADYNLYLTMARPHGFIPWIEKILAPSDLTIDRVLLDIEAIGDLLSFTGEIPTPERIVVVENRKHMLRCRVYQGQDIQAVFDIAVSWDYHMLLERVRGDSKLVESITEFLRRALQDPTATNPKVAKLFLFTTDGERSIEENLLKNKYITALDLKRYFKFRDPENVSPDSLAVPLGVLGAEIRDRFNAD